MATITGVTPGAEQPLKSETGASPAKTAPGTGKSRQLWQVPTFVVGALVLASVCYSRPGSGEGPGRQIDRELAAVRQILGRADGDLHLALERAQHALDLAGRHAYAARQAEAFFLVGSAEVRLAEQPAAVDAATLWKSARHNLEEAEKLGVAENDRGRLEFRLAKALYFTDGDPKAATDRLWASVEMADNHADAYILVTKAYLNLPVPNLEGALAANEKLRMLHPLTPEMQAQAQLQGGELLLQLGRAEAARKVLEKISAQAPGDVLAQARILRGRSYQAENNWAQAAELWDAALADTNDAGADRGQILFYLGQCRARLGEPDKAVRAWEECLQRGKDIEVAAAALALAEIYLQGKTPEKALEPMTRALDNVSGPSAWKNPIVKLEKARECYEQAVVVYRKGGTFMLAMRTLEIYQKLAIPARIDRLRGETLAEWAQARREQASHLPPGSDTKSEEEKAARRTSLEASEAFIKAADQLADDARESALWQACVVLVEGQCEADAVKALNRYLAVGKKPERVGEAWYRLGECRRVEGTALALADAATAYKNCIETNAAFVTYARYQLALMLIARGELDEAEAELDRNLKTLHREPDPPMLEKTCFALGALAFQRGKFLKVKQTLEGVVKVDPPPVTPEGTLARFHLAESYRQLADQEMQKIQSRGIRTEEERQHAQKQYEELMSKAAAEYISLAGFLDSPEGQGLLTPEYRARIPFVTAECYFALKDWETALAIYRLLIERYSRRPAPASDTSAKNPDVTELVALYPQLRLEATGGMVRCFFAMNRGPEMTQALEKLRAGLSEVDPSVQAEYRKWIDGLADQLRRMPPQ